MDPALRIRLATETHRLRGALATDLRARCRVPVSESVVDALRDALAPHDAR